jgi:hypothetical protein
MKPATVLAYLGAPAVVAVGVFSVAVTREPFGLEMIATYIVFGFLFYAAPHLLWVFIALIGKFSNRAWHVGLVASTIALAAISSLWALPGDPSGLPMQWLVYWPLAIVLQVILAGLTAL